MFKIKVDTKNNVNFESPLKLNETSENQEVIFHWHKLWSHRRDILSVKMILWVCTSTCDGMWMNISLNHSRPRQYFMICIYKKSNKLLRWEYLQTKSTLNVSFPIVPSVWGACPAGERLSVIVSEPTYHTTHIQPDTLRPARNQTDSWISWEENCWNILKIIKTLTWL